MAKHKSYYPEIDPVQDDATRFIDEICRTTGCSPTEIARRSGLSPSTITRIYPVATVRYTLSSRSIAKIKRAFPSFFAHPISDSTEASKRPDPVIATHNIAVFSLEAKAVAQVDGDNVQLQAALFGIEAWSDLSFNPVSHMQWWENGTGEEDRFFGIYVAGDAMYPRLCPAEIAVVDSIKPVTANADAFIRVHLGKDNQIVFFARVVERTAAHISVVFYGQGDKKVELPRSVIREIFPIVGIITNSF